MKKDKVLIKNFIWNTIGIMLNACNSLFFLIVVSRINGLNDAGIFSLAFSTALLLYTIGLYSGRMFQVTDIENKITDKDYIFSKIISCSLMIILGLGFVIIRGYEMYKALVMLLLIIYKATEAFSDTLYAVLQKNEKLYQSGQSLALKSIIGIICFIIVDFISKNLIIACLSIVLANLIIMLVFDYQRVKKYIPKNTKVDMENVKDIFKKEFFVFINSFLSNYILNASKYAIDNFMLDEDQAKFGYIIMPATVISLFSQFILMPYTNRIREMYANNKIKELKSNIRKIIGIVILFGILVIFVAYLIGIPVLEFIYNTRLNEYRLDLVIILFAYILYAISYIDLVVLTTARKTFIQFLVYGFTAVVTLVISNIFVSQMGIRGASLTCVVALGLLFVLYSYNTEKFYKKGRKIKGDVNV